jgi:hypothetical protein
MNHKALMICTAVLIVPSMAQSQELWTCNENPRNPSYTLEVNHAKNEVTLHNAAGETFDFPIVETQAFRITFRDLGGNLRYLDANGAQNIRRWIQLPSA